MKALEAHLQHQLTCSNFFWHRLRAHAVSTFFPADRPFRVLDLGAGAGLLGEFIVNHYAQANYHFIEPIESLEEELSLRFGSDRNAKSAVDFREFDYLVLLDVLEHQPDDREFASELVSKIKPDSVLILTVPAMQMLWSQWDVALGHFRRYGKSELRRAFAGLPVQWLEVSYLFPEMVPLGLVRKLRRPSHAAPGRDETDLPALPRTVNGALYVIARLSFAARAGAPLGTSILGALRRT